MTERNAADIGLSGGVDPDTVERNVLADELESCPHSKLVLHDGPIGPSIEEKTTLNRGRNWQSGFIEGFAVGARDRKVGHNDRPVMLEDAGFVSEFEDDLLSLEFPLKLLFLCACPA